MFSNEKRADGLYSASISTQHPVGLGAVHQVPLSGSGSFVSAAVRERRHKAAAHLQHSASLLYGLMLCYSRSSIYIFSLYIHSVFL